MDESITAIVPAFNEGSNILKTLEALKQIEDISEIIVVNDGSTDDTYQVLQRIKNVKTIHNEKNRGKGYAIKSALTHVSTPYVLMVDADLKESAIEMKKLVDHCEKDKNTMLVATYPKPLKKGGFGLVKQLSRKGLYLLTSKSSDSVLSGQRLAPTAFMKAIDLPDDFGLEFKMTLEALRNSITIIDIPVNIRHRETGRDMKGFVHRGKQFVHIFKVVVRELIG